MANRQDIDDWGIGVDNTDLDSQTGRGKRPYVILAFLIVCIVCSISFWVFSPAKETKKVDEKPVNKYDNLTSKDDNYGYPATTEIPKNVEKVIDSVEGDVNKEGSEPVKAYLEEIRDSVVETEKDWDVTKLGSRKYIDYKLPSSLEMVLLEDNSVLKLVLKHTLEMGLKDELRDGFYLVINPLDEAQMYLKKEFYTRAEQDTTTNYLVYINDVSQYNLPEALLSKLGYGDRKKFYDVRERLKIKDYPMIVKIKGGNVVAKKTNVKDLGGF